MKASSALGACALLLLAACDGVSVGTSDDGSSDDGSAVVDETAIAGANANDRSIGKDGEELLTGAMVPSPSGRYIVMQRNTVTLIYDVAAATYHEFATPLTRVAFAKNRETLFAFGGGEVMAIDLATQSVLWKTALSDGCSLLRISPDDNSLLVGSASLVNVVEPSTGSVRTSTSAASAVAYSAFVPGQSRVLLVGHTVWRDGGPHTPVVDLDLSGASEAKTTDVLNCEAPIVVVPNGARAFLSPTYCSPGKQAVPGKMWTNPDPVSVIELNDGAAFAKNLPGFGPVAMSKDGSRIVAYLDVKRMDASMFEDKTQVPWENGQRYHLMTIDPATLKFQLAPIGNAIPRFAMTPDGRGLLVDASAKVESRMKLAARATATIGADGLTANVETNLDVFGSSAAFGFFDLTSQSFSAFSGPIAPLDRFVQFSNSRYVLTLATRQDGLGGTPYMIDLANRATWALQGNFGTGVRDVGLSADGTIALLRLRLAANVHDSGYYSREALCTSTTGECGASFTATYEATVPFATVPPPPPPGQPTPTTPPECPGGHDC
ncbi:hypothetical protein AKJ09_07870 [Labilithrix luteola]|uniref:Uncharacterized protein n=1 Tax=Labilithrix luteola TaxID=1391654 RepID=A0A0K1Q6E2_9BACT|nr:hypothetical protein [Labilithrix luteola]AKV01207.1 hypothetical protein AKJ09_07870 [Labilithrix luteola]